MNIWEVLQGQTPLPHTVRQAPVLNQRVTISLAAGAKQRIDVGGQRFWSLIVQVTTGALDVCLSDDPEAAPDFRFVAALGPQQVWFHAYDYNLSLRNPQGTVSQGVVRILGG